MKRMMSEMKNYWKGVFTCTDDDPEVLDDDTSLCQ